MKARKILLLATTPLTFKKGHGPQKDPGALRSTILRLISDKDLMKWLGEEGRKTVLKRFPLRKAIKEIEEVYEGIVNR